MNAAKLLALLPLLVTGTLSRSQSLLDDLAITVRGISREFAYTNKQTAFLYGETNSENRTSWQGFNVFGQEFLDDYEIRIDEKKLERSAAIATIVYPDYLKRSYAGGIVEEVRMADSLPLFSVTITSPKPVHVDLLPMFTDGRSAEEYHLQLKSEKALIARKRHLTKTDRENYPVWLLVQGAGFLPQLKATKRGTQFSPVILVASRAESHTILFCVGDDAAEAESTANSYLHNRVTLDHARRERMEKLLRDTYVKTGNARFDKALAWAKLSLDALMMNQGSKGIFAGLPWFNNYWGRDTFIALPGATLVQGRFTDAKQILQSFADFQQLDSSSTDYGRIPNIITTTDKAYNTADATPRFVMMAREYVERSGDTTFMAEIYPTIIRSIDGTLKYHCDSLGFLVHGDQETWMDAAGPDGCWSPRGNRANDVQALWAQQLEAGIWFASRFGDAISADLWNKQLQKLKKNFAPYFILNGVVADRLRQDGSQDMQLRPNQIFTSPLLSERERSEVLRSVVNNLTYRYGVASLSQDDPNFHPYHQYEPYYPKDAAYHNGTVWTWLQGAVISELCTFGEEELAYTITGNSIHQILDRGAVGTQSELLDAIARPGENEPRLSGTFSQAWNLAEFIRNFYDDYLGVRVSLLNHHMVIRPRLPKALGSIRATINLNGRALPIEIDRERDSTVVMIDGRTLRKGGTAEVAFPLGKANEVQAHVKILPQSQTRVLSRSNEITLYVNGSKSDDLLTRTVALRESPTDLHLATPRLRSGLKSLKGPDYPLLSNAVIKAKSISAKLLVEASDPSGDDSGTGAYEYPKNSAFVPGSFDLTRFKVEYDRKNAYFTLTFRALSNPGWHPEYGFQLTYVAIAVDEDGVPGSGRRVVGNNANYLLDEKHGYEKLILVGGGVRVEDRDGRILAAYVPAASDVSNPLGDSEKATIRFAIPLKYLGSPSTHWTFTVLTGAQDDHGGAGLGEFRTVNKDTGEWNGGGKMQPDEPNVYDVLTAQAR